MTALQRPRPWIWIAWSTTHWAVSVANSFAIAEVVEIAGRPASYAAAAR